MAPSYLAGDLTGRRYGRLVVLRFICRNNWHSWWHCQCDCGGETVVRMNTLRTGRTLSCGCLRLQRIIEMVTTHGHSRGGKLTPTYTAYRSAKNRCHNPNNKSYRDYGGRGITMHSTWLDDFSQFVKDMGERPPDRSLERSDNDKGYEPGNCIWGSRTEQANNRRSSRFVTVNGRRMTIMQASLVTGLPAPSLYQRINKGWPETRWFEPIRVRLSAAEIAPSAPSHPAAPSAQSVAVQQRTALAPASGADTS